MGTRNSPRMPPITVLRIARRPFPFRATGLSFVRKGDSPHLRSPVPNEYRETLHKVLRFRRRRTLTSPSAANWWPRIWRETEDTGIRVVTQRVQLCNCRYERMGSRFETTKQTSLAYPGVTVVSEKLIPVPDLWALNHGEGFSARPLAVERIVIARFGCAARTDLGESVGARNRQVWIWDGPVLRGMRPP
jgi:hypothetical protein